MSCRITRNQVSGWYQKHLVHITPHMQPTEDMEWLYVHMTKLSDKNCNEEYVKILADKYKQYYQNWLSNFEDASLRYISKENSLKPFHIFLDSKMYLNDFTTLKDGRSKYLFSPLPVDEVKKQLEKFKALCKSPW